MAADPIVYCLENVTDYAQFERLCHDLMALEGHPSIEPLGGFKDKGRDAVHVSRSDPNTASVFAYSVREDWRAKLSEDAEKIRNHGHTCDRFVFLSTAYFGASERDEAIRHVGQTYGWELELYGLERLRVLLAATHPRVLALHPQIFTPPFFPQSGGISLAEARDHLVIDYHQRDEALVSWLARRLGLAGYLVWCRSLAPIAGSSLNDTVQSLIKYRAAQYLAVLSPAALSDPDLSVRRGLAASTSKDIVIPVLAELVDDNLLDVKTRSLERVGFEKSWATGLAQLLNVLAARHCPRSPADTGVILHSFAPPNVIANEPEQVISNRFQVLKVPSLVTGFNAAKPFGRDDAKRSARVWPARRIDNHRVLSFFQPPEDIRAAFGFKERGGAVWADVREVDGIKPDHLVSELIRRSLEAHFVKRGLKVCPERGSIFFPEKLCKSDRLYFVHPDGSKPFVAVTGRRKLYRPTGSSFYRYHLSPSFDVKAGSDGKFSVLIRVRVRMTDDEGNLFPGKGSNSRRKHLCASWFNDEWLNRTLAVVQFAADRDRIVVAMGSEGLIEVSSCPDQWTVPVRLVEEAVRNARQSREEVLAYSRDDEAEAEEGQ